MNILSILRDFGLTGDEIEAWAPQWRVLAQAYSIESNYVYFAASLRRAISGIPSPTITAVYRAARYFASMPEAFGGIPESLTIPLQYGKIVTIPVEGQSILLPYAYTVTTTFVNPRTGDKWSASTLITRNSLGSLGEIEGEAYADALDMLEQSDPWSEEESFYQDLDFTSAITNFTYYMP